MSIQKTFSFPRSTQRTQTHRVNLPQLQRVIKVTSKNGSVRIASQSGDEVVLEFSGGNGETVSTGGGYIPGDSKTVTVNQSGETRYIEWDENGPGNGIDSYTTGGPPGSISYNSAGYSGTLYPVKSTWTGEYRYYPDRHRFRENLPRTRSSARHTHSYFWSQDYTGTVTRPGRDNTTYTTYYTYGVEIEYEGNDAPVISGQDANLGAKNDAFDISYQVTDRDNVRVVEKINGTTIRSLDNAPKGETLTISVSREKLFSLPLNSDNVIEISADDGKGGVAYRRYTFRRTNSAPQISGEDSDLGQKTQPFSVSFSAADQENDPMSAKIFLSDKLLKTYDSLVSAQENSFLIPKLEFVQLPRGAHRVRIEVQDQNAATAMRNLSFSRDVGRLSYTLTRATDQKARQIILAPTWFVAEGATAKVEVCNNALDELPAWENMTEKLQNDQVYTFVNQDKTAEQWAVGVRITIERAQATATSWLAGFGGAYK
ncbi:MAG: hypothetical protein Q4A78_03075 [Peptostreptococcaceae bacterium]|nr:hypothetical protein [Peptostreptococcaceae bacterium]